MELFATDLQKIDFLLEADAFLFDEELYAAALAAEEVVSEELPPEKRPRYITNYIGSKQKLVDWIWANTPDDVKSAFDAFSGSGVVGYMYKTKGLKVITNDRLRFAWHAARAIIENNNTRLSAEDIDGLVKDNPKAGDFVQKTFKGIFFAKGVHKIIDHIRANIDELSGYKKDIALFALGRACLSGKGGFGHFSATQQNNKRCDTPKEFIERYKNMCNRINSLVFDNGRENKAYNKDIMELAPEVKTDLAYFDPPYATHFSTTNYERSYHFLEGLMTYWEGKEIEKGNKARNYVIDAPTVTQANANEFFTNFLGKSKHIKYWIISYRDQAYPSEAQLKKIISTQGKASRMKSKKHQYSITSKRGEASYPKEHLFVCKPASQSSGSSVAGFSVESSYRETGEQETEELHSAAMWEETANEIRYRVRDSNDFIPDSFRRKQLDGVEGVSIVIAKLKPEKVPQGHDPEAMVVQSYRFTKKTDDNPDGWTIEKAKEWIEKHQPKKESAQASTDSDSHMKTTLSIEIGLKAEADENQSLEQSGDKRFEFTLCHAGTNRNGDHFTVEELASRYQTAVNKKIDLKHSQDITDIVGGVVASDFVRDDKSSRVDCVGELFTHDNDHARLAYKLMKKGIITQVSMECDYQEGECSVCGKKVRSKAEYCVHLKKYKGGEFNGQPVYEILHGITFTGLGLLDRKGADENAKIKTVSQLSGVGCQLKDKEDQPKTDNRQPATDNRIIGGNQMPEEKDKQGTGSGDGKRTDDPGSQAAEKEKDAQIKKLQEENQQLKQQVADLQKQIEKYETEAKAAARKSKAEKLLSKLEQKGMTFNEQERETELKRLSELSDDAFAATESAYERIPDAQKKEPDPEDNDKKDKKEPAGKAKADDGDDKKMRSDGGVIPYIVNDKKQTLEDRLKTGFDAAYKHRVSANQ